MKISLIITTKNENRTISKLLASIANQTRKPDEVVIADAASVDGTVERIKSWQDRLPIRLISLKSGANRAIGRNTAIAAARFPCILITDGGCTLASTWIEVMADAFNGGAVVVAGFYTSAAESVFEQCVAPYALVMPDRLDLETFLPATRSMGITKELWDSLGGFPEHYRYAEDYTFARRIAANKYPIKVEPDAIVYWRPRSTFGAFFRMILEHAYGDGEAGNYRPKVLLVFLRVFGALGLFWFGFHSQQIAIIYFTLGLLLIYCALSVLKNYRYVRHYVAIGILPLLQLLSDGAVVIGTLGGIFSRGMMRFRLDKYPRSID